MRLDNFLNQNDSLSFIAKTIQQKAEKHEILNQQQKVYKFNEPNQQSRTIYGICRSGKFGVRSDIVDAETGHPEFSRYISDAELIPFYYCFWIPKNRDEGIVILQRNGNQSIRDSIYRSVLKPFNRAFPKFRMELNKLVDAQYIRDLLNNWRISQARLIKFGLPTDMADTLEQEHLEEYFNMEVSVRAKQKQDINLRDKVARVLTSRNYAEFIEWRDFKYDDIKVEFERNNKHKTIDLLNLAKLKTGRDVTGSIDYGEDQHPDFESIDGEAKGTIKEIRESLGVND